MRVAICDDDRLCLEMTEAAIRHWSQETGVEAQVYLFQDGDALLEHYLKENVDLILLDIVMPLFSGMETAREIRQRDDTVSLVFLTSSPEFALDSYDVRASGYLLKPLCYDKLAQVLESCARRCRDSSPLLVRTEDGFYRLEGGEIESVEAQNKHCLLTLRNGSTRQVLSSLAALEEQLLGCPDFFKCHRSYLVNLRCVVQLRTNELETRTGAKIPVARSAAKPLREACLSR